MILIFKRETYIRKEEEEREKKGEKEQKKEEKETMHKALRLAGQPWVNISFREAHSNSMSLQSPESQGERHFYLWKQNGFLLSPLTLSSLISLFLLCLNPKFGPSIILTCPEFFIFPEPKSNKFRVQRALSHSRLPPALFSQGYRVLRADDVRCQQDVPHTASHQTRMH